MKVILQNHSSYPAGEHPSPLRPPLEESLISDETLARVLADQAGLDVITDGWPDPVTRLTAGLDGLRVGEHVHLFGEECCQPIVIGPVRRSRPIMRDRFLRATRKTRLPVKPVLPGPYTLARLSRCESGPYAGVAALAQAFSDVLAAEVVDLQQAGARYIQINEPAILSHPADIRLLRSLLEPIWNVRGTAEMIVATYCGDVEPLYAQLNSLPADIVALDCTASHNLRHLIAATGASKVLALGVVDAGRSPVEEADALARQAELMLKRYVLDRVHLLPSRGLHGLPRAAARAKLDVLCRVRELLHLAG